jgi:hypothetical protein
MVIMMPLLLLLPPNQCLMDSNGKTLIGPYLNLSRAITGPAMVIMTMNSGMASMNVHAANMHARMLASTLLSPAGRGNKDVHGE